jgi:tape measure domain-containing protein
MGSVGAVSISLELDRSKYDKQIKELQKSDLELTADLCLDTKKFFSQFEKLKDGLGCIPVELCLDIKKFEADIKAISDHTISIQAELIIDKKQLDNLTSQVSVEVSTSGQGAKQAGQDFTNQISKGMEDALTDVARNSGMEEFGKGLINNLAGALPKTLLFPVKNIAEGFFMGIGDSFSKSLSPQFTKVFKQQTPTIQAFAEDFGDFFGQSLEEGLVKLDIYKRLPRGTPATPLKQASTPALPPAAVTIDVIPLKELDSTSKTLVATFKQLNDTVAASVKGLQTLRTSPQSTGASGTFLKGDVSNITAPEARSQVGEAVGKLKGKVDRLSKSADPAKRQQQVAQLLEEIARLEAQIDADVKNKDIPESVRRSLAQLKSRRTTTKTVNIAKLKSSLVEFQDAGLQDVESKSKELSSIIAQLEASFSVPSLSKMAKGMSGLSLSKASLKSPNELNKLALTNYQKIFEELAKRSGLDSAKVADSMPQLKFGGLPTGVAGRYNPTGNVVQLTGDFRKKLANFQLSKDDFDTIAHEIRHAFQFKLGKLSLEDIIGKGGAGVGLKSLGLGKGREGEVEASVQDFRQAFKQQFGRNPTYKIIAAVRKLEEDATQFASESIAVYRRLLQTPVRSGLKQEGDFSAIASQFSSLRGQVKDVASLKPILALLRRVEELQKSLAEDIRNEADKGVREQLGRLKNVQVSKLQGEISQVYQGAKEKIKPPSLEQKGRGAKQVKIAQTDESLTNLKSEFERLKPQAKDATSLKPLLNVVQQMRKLRDDVTREISDPKTSAKEKRRLAELQRSQLNPLAGAVESEYAAIKKGVRKSIDDQNKARRKFERQQDFAKNRPDVEFLSEGYFDRVYRWVESTMFRRMSKAGVKPKERRTLMSEAAGMAVSGAALVNPLATAATALAPLAPALAPLAITGTMLSSLLTPLIQSMAETLKRIEPVKKRFEYSGGGKEGGKQQEKFARGIAEDLNVPLATAMDEYSKLASAAKNTALEGQPVQELFEGISLSVKALGANTDDARLIYYAFTQMLSKGRISMEELRQQLGEKFPPAIGTFARAMGVSVQQFNKLVETGSLVSSEVLPKVAKQLKAEFGEAARSSATTFTSAMVRIENAVFKTQEALAEMFAPVLTVFANFFAMLQNFIGSNIGSIVKVLGAALIGVTAQFLVGLTVILKGTGLVATMTNALAPLFGRVFATLTPFAVGVMVDFMDDVLGAQHSVMENMTNFFANAVIGIFLTLEGLAKKIGELFEGFGGGGGGDFFGGIVNELKSLYSLIPSSVIEFGALFVMLTQMSALFKLQILSQLMWIGDAIKMTGKAFLESARNGKVFQSSLNTLTAGFSKLREIATFAAASLVVLFFAKADFSDPLRKSFENLADGAVSSFKRIEEAVDGVKGKVGEIPNEMPDFKSKGFDLTVGLGEQFGGGAFRTDDIIKMIRDAQLGYEKSLLGSGQINQGEYEERTQNIKDKTITVAEKNFQDRIIKLQELSETIGASIDKAGILKPGFAQNEAGKGLTEVKNIDKQVFDLQRQRVDRMDAGYKPESDDVIIQIDKRVNELLKQRSEAQKRIQSVATEIIKGSDTLGEVVKAIKENTEIPESAKQQAIDLLNPIIAQSAQAKEKLEEMGAVDLSPLTEQFQKVKKRLDETQISFDKFNAKLTLSQSQGQAGIQERAASGAINDDQAKKQSIQLEQQGLSERLKKLREYVSDRKDMLRDLYAIPNPTDDQKKLIDDTKKEIEKSELETAQTRIQLAQKVLEGKRTTEQQALEELRRANTAAQSVAQKTESERVGRIKGLQVSGLIQPEDAEKLIGDEQTRAAKEQARQQIEAANNQIETTRRLRSQNIIDVRRAGELEREANQQIAEANLKIIEAELQARERAKQRRIQQIEEITAKESATQAQKFSDASQGVKSRQLGGKLTDDEASREQSQLEIVDTEERLKLKQLELSRTKQLRNEGTLSLKEYTGKERQLLQDIEQMESQLLDQQLQREKLRKEARIKAIEDVNQAREKAVVLSTTRRVEDVKSERADLEAAGADPEVTKRESDAKISQIEADAVQQRLALKRKEFADNQMLVAEGTRTRVEGAKVEADLLKEIADLEVEVVDKQLEANERLREARIKAIEEANKLAEETVALSQATRITAVKESQATGGYGIDPEAAKREAERRISEIEQDGVQERIQLKQKELSDEKSLIQAGLRSREEGNANVRRLTQDLAQLNQEAVDKEIAQQDRLRDERTRTAEEYLRTRESQANQAVASIEREKDANDLLQESISRTNSLMESRVKLSKAVADAQISQGEGQLKATERALELSKKLKEKNLDPQKRELYRSQLSQLGFSPDTSEMEILNRKFQIEDAIAQLKAKSQEQELQSQMQLLELENKRRILQSQAAVQDKEMERLKVEQDILVKQGELDKAIINGNQQAIVIANIDLQIAKDKLSISDQQLASAQANLAVQQEISAEEMAAMQATQAVAREQIKTEELLRKQRQQEEMPTRNWFKPLPPGRANGGFVTAKNTYMVGERGPELFIPSTNGQIVSNAALTSKSYSAVNTSIPKTSAPTVAAGGFNRDVVTELQKLNNSLGKMASEPRSISVNTANPLGDTLKILSNMNRP